MMTRMLLVSFALLALAAAEHVDVEVDVDDQVDSDVVDEAEDVATVDDAQSSKTCLTILPEEASKIASKQAQVESEKRHKVMLAKAATDYTNAKADALQKETAALANANSQKSAAVQGANAQYTEMIARADAEAKKIVSHDMAQVDKKYAVMKRDAIAHTKDEMEQITWKHTKALEIAKGKANQAAREGKVMAHIAKAKIESIALEETKRLYIRAGKKHRHALEDIKIAERDGKNQAKVRAIKTRQAGRRDAEVDKENLIKIAERKFRNQFDAARATQKAALADADITRTQILTDSIAKAKTEEMNAWVDAMVLAMDAGDCAAAAPACVATNGATATVAACTCSTMTCAATQKCTVVAAAGAVAASGTCAAR